MDRLLDPPIAFAHRGASAHADGNTLEAFRLALRLGATGLETDAWVTADGAVVLHHDGVLRAGLRRRRLAELRRSQLPPGIPTLEELYDGCGTAYELSVDVKDPAAAAPTVAIATAAGAVGRLWLCGAELDDVVAWRALSPDVRLVDSTRLRRIKGGPERRAATLAQQGVDGLNMHWSDWTGGLTTLVHRFGRMAFAWDAQHRRQLDTVLRMGIDGVFSDRVDVMVDAVAGRRPGDPGAVVP